MKSLTAVRKKSPNYPVEFKIKMVELSHRPEISVAQLAREHGINDNLLFKWRQYWREGKLRPPSTTENNVPELLVSMGSTIICCSSGASTGAKENYVLLQQQKTTCLSCSR
ncbi:transposase [Escherichia coli]|uniref:transposase n=1 Tax=Escherichia coli TaxID=562 RepID=UPI000D594951|nr:transposase [Escherichia coli]